MTDSDLRVLMGTIINYVVTGLFGVALLATIGTILSGSSGLGMLAGITAILYGISLIAVNGPYKLITTDGIDDSDETFFMVIVLIALTLISAIGGLVTAIGLLSVAAGAGVGIGAWAVSMLMCGVATYIASTLVSKIFRWLHNKRHSNETVSRPSWRF